MKFYEEVKKLQEENKETIVMIKNGIFFIAVGKDALVLEKIFHLRPVCFKENVCKCVIPVKSIEKYIKAMEERELSIVLYNYDKDGGIGKVEEILRISNSKINKEEYKLDCTKCWYKNKKESNKDENIIKRLQEKNKMEKEVNINE